MASLLAIGGGCERGMCPLPPEAEAIGFLNIATSISYQFLSVMLTTDLVIDEIKNGGML